MNILALEPFHGGSHRAFLDGYIKHSRHSVYPVTMTARFWKWRMHGAAVTLARKALQAREEGFETDVIFASNMVNVPAFLALVRGEFTGVPVVLYMHENHLTYPLSPDTPREDSFAYINYLSCLSADRIVFNSLFHFQEFIEALPKLLRSFPDYTHLHTIQLIRDKSMVLHPGLNLKDHDAYAADYSTHVYGPGLEPPIVLWNQRWEYEKNPEGFFRLMNRLDDVGAKFRLILAGEHFEEQPHEFEQAWRRYADRIIHYGYAEDFEEYSRLLHRSDIIVSTSIHEFFGVAIMEAVYCGCHPLLPNRLSYPELVPENLHRPLLHAPVLYDDEDHLFQVLFDILKGKERPLPYLTCKNMPADLDWNVHVEDYDRLFEEILEKVPGAG